MARRKNKTSATKKPFKGFKNAGPDHPMFTSGFVIGARGLNRGIEFVHPNFPHGRPELHISHERLTREPEGDTTARLLRKARELQVLAINLTVDLGATKDLHKLLTAIQRVRLAIDEIEAGVRGDNE